MQMNIYMLIALFSKKWQETQGYKPAPFQKAIAMQRLERGQSIDEIINALVSQRV
jgi:hypothetical protein